MVYPIPLWDVVFFLGLLEHHTADLRCFLVLFVQIHCFRIFIFHQFRIVSSHGYDYFFVFLPITKSKFVGGVVYIYLFFVSENFNILATYNKVWLYHIRVTDIVVKQSKWILWPSFTSNLQTFKITLKSLLTITNHLRFRPSWLWITWETIWTGVQTYQSVASRSRPTFPQLSCIYQRIVSRTCNCSQTHDWDPERRSPVNFFEAINLFGCFPL